MTLRIISINDVYKLDHLPRLASLVRALRLPAPDVTISVIAGDFVAPSLMSCLDAGRAMIDSLNAVGIDYAILGNHEDDITGEELHARVHEFAGTWLSSNVEFDAKMPRDAIVTVGEHSVGLLGVVVVDAAVYRDRPFGGAATRPADPCAVAMAAELRARGCAVVVALTHQGMDADRELARTGAVELIIGGHEHVPFLEQVGATWIVKAGEDAVAAIVSDVTFGDGPPQIAVRRIATDDYPEDAAVRARVDGHLAKVRELAEATLVRVAPGEMLSSIGTRARQTTLGTLLCTRIRDAMHADVALVNGGAIRASRDYPDRFTYGDLEAEVPFENELVVVAMTGAEIQRAVGASRARAPIESGGFLQAAPDPATLDPTRTYSVALVRNLFSGMDHNEPLMAIAAERPSAIPPLGNGRDIKHVLAEAFAVELWHRLGGFDRIDANRDGTINEAEILAALAKVSQQAPSTVVAQLLIRTLDRDGDARIDRTEG